MRHFADDCEFIWLAPWARRHLSSAFGAPLN
jgi:hypothetical protein